MLTRKPRKGDRVRWPVSGYTATVVKTPEGDDNLCWIKREQDRDALPFIWRFWDGLNREAEIVGDVPADSC